MRASAARALARLMQVEIAQYPRKRKMDLLDSTYG
jgi:hypothetical protein